MARSIVILCKLKHTFQVSKVFKCSCLTLSPNIIDLLCLIKLINSLNSVYSPTFQTLLASNQVSDCTTTSTIVNKQEPESYM